MFDALRAKVLRVLRVPHDPDPPMGAPGSLRVFRAGRNYYKMRLALWGLGQTGALFGIVFSLVFLSRLEREINDLRDDEKNAAAEAAATAASAGPVTHEGASTTAIQPAKAPRKSRHNLPPPVQQIARKFPMWLFPLLKLLKWGGVLLYLVQIPITYALARLDYEMRWYMVTDRSLRIRAGVTRVLESTMSFANVQQVVVSQGPLQRLAGIADVHVQSAGGGGDEHHQSAGDALHKGVFHGVENAQEIRDLILERLRQFRQAGLGDPDDAPATESVRGLATPGIASAPNLQSHSDSATLAAAQELLDEARALRRALT